MTLRTPPHSIDLLDAIREVSWSAHRWRDRAAAHYSNHEYKRATSSKVKKVACYNLKERGIAAAHQAGLLRYVGSSPQDMGVYAYGNAGTACFHSCLHPVGGQRTLVPDHPEVLFVPAQKQRKRICDVEFTLVALPAPDPAIYERSSPPRVRRAIFCYECGGEGHIARNCPQRLENYFDEFDYDDAKTSLDNCSIEN